MSVQRFSAYHSGDLRKIGLWDDPEGYWVTYADHARIVAEMEQAHAAALVEQAMTCLVHMREDDEHDEQVFAAGRADGIGWEKADRRKRVRSTQSEAWQYGYEAGFAAAPRTLTADDVLAAVNAIDYDAVLAATPAPKTARAQVYTLHALTRDAILTLIHDGEATPQVKPCSTCGEPVAYLTARPGWAGGWLHHPARPLDGHPAAIDGEATT